MLFYNQVMLLHQPKNENAGKLIQLLVNLYDETVDEDEIE